MHTLRPFDTGALLDAAQALRERGSAGSFWDGVASWFEASWLRVRAVGITRTLVMRETLTQDPAFEAVANIVRQELDALVANGAFGNSMDLEAS